MDALHTGIAPVIIGLAVGIAFLILMGFISGHQVASSNKDIMGLVKSRIAISPTQTLSIVEQDIHNRAPDLKEVRFRLSYYNYSIQLFYSYGPGIQKYNWLLQVIEKKPELLELPVYYVKPDDYVVVFNPENGRPVQIGEVAAYEYEPLWQVEKYEPKELEKLEGKFVYKVESGWFTTKETEGILDSYESIHFIDAANGKVLFYNATRLNYDLSGERVIIRSIE